MNENPFAHSDELVPSPRRFGVASRVMWFLFGFGVCFVLCAAWFTFASYRNYQALGPQDYSRIWPAYSPETKPEWLEHAKFRVVNGFGIVAAEDVKNASAMIWPVSGRLMTSYEDTDGDGHANSLSLWDKKGRVFQFQLADDYIKSYEFTPDVVSYGTTFYDYNLDGNFDQKIELQPGKAEFWLLVDSQWRRLIPEGDGQGRVDIDGEWARAELVDSQWRLSDQPSLTPTSQPPTLNPEP